MIVALLTTLPSSPKRGNFRERVCVEMKNLKNIRILVADDEECIRFTFTDFLQDEGYTVFTAESLSECVQSLQDVAYDVLFLDVNLGDENSIETIQTIKQIQPGCKIVMMTGGLNSGNIARARQYGAMDYIVKPVYKPSLLYLTQKAINH